MYFLGRFRVLWLVARFSLHVIPLVSVTPHEDANALSYIHHTVIFN